MDPLASSPGCPPHTRLADVTFCVLDLETTGCDSGVDGITEIGAVKFCGGELVGTFHTLVNARQSIPTFIALLTGISDSMLADAPPIEQVLPSLLEFVSGSVIVGHNVGFDVRFLNAALDGCSYAALAGRPIDTLPLARKLLRDDTPDCRLSTLAAVLGLEHLPTHRALDDARATAELLHLLIERATGYGVTALDDLFELPRLARHRALAKLPMTNHLPREPGVFLFHGGGDAVIHVGRADDVRRHVRRYFASNDRRRIAPLLRETRRVSCIIEPDPLAAEIIELRLVQRHRPRYDRAAIQACAAACYVHIDPSARTPRLALVREPRARGLHLGPLPTNVMGRLVLDAVTKLEPAAATDVLGGSPDAAFAALRERIGALAASGDRVGAARARAGAQALAGAVDRQQVMDETRRRGVAVIASGSRMIGLEHGLLAGVGTGGDMPAPLAVAPPGPAAWSASSRPLPRWASSEVLRVGRRLARGET